MMVAPSRIAMVSRTSSCKILLSVVAVIISVSLAAPSDPQVSRKVFQTTVAGNIKAEYLYHLSNFKGPVKFGWVRVYPEPQENEIYVMAGTSINIFNDSGMETYEFGFDADLGNFSDAAVDEDGNILALSYVGFQCLVTKQNYRGELISRIGLKNLPPELSGFLPSRIHFRDRRLYLSDLSGMKVVVTSEDGAYETRYDLAAIIGLTEDERRDTGISNIHVSEDGSLLFTVPVVANVFIISPDRKVSRFGRRGSGPGRFGIPSDVISDSRGNYFVVDTLKCAVLVFDKDLNFLTEFGYRGPYPSNLIAPRSLSMDKKGKLYVTQSSLRGVSVFQIRYE